MVVGIRKIRYDVIRNFMFKKYFMLGNNMV